jgi:hypothetical protein
MNRLQRAAAVSLTSLAFALGSAAPVFADGAASTRNIIIFGAAAAAGTAAIVNHNKKVHERYAEDANNLAAAQAEASAAESDARVARGQAEQEHNAYLKAHSAYVREASLAARFKRQSETQHDVIAGLRRQLADEKRLAALEAQQHKVSFWPWQR